eukprot:gene9799-2124_t
MENDESLQRPTSPTQYTLNHILQDAVLLAMFECHCMKELCVENLLFLVKESKFCKIEDKKELKLKAMDIYEEFLVHDAPYQLNITEKKISPIRTVLFEKNTDVTKELFKNIKYEADHLLVDSFQRFKNTMDFQQFVKPTKLKKKNSFSLKNKKSINNEKRISGRSLLQFVANISFQKEKDKKDKKDFALKSNLSVPDTKIFHKDKKGFHSFKKMSLSELPRMTFDEHPLEKKHSMYDSRNKKGIDHSDSEEEFPIVDDEF